MAIFLIGWTTWWLGIPLAVVGLYLCLNIFKDVTGKVRFGSALAEWTVAAVMLLWAIHAGIGEFAWQNRGDHLRLATADGRIYDVVAERFRFLSNEGDTLYYVRPPLPDLDSEIISATWTER